jgi:GT2 family glycosyltransferase
VDYALLNNEANLGACTARNQALGIASGSYLAFADNDLAVRSRNWLRVLAERLESGPRIGIVGPKLVFPFPPYALECAGVAISPSGRVQYRGRGEAREGTGLEACATRTAGPVQCLISACWLMKRAVYEEIGGLDEVFNPAQYEDLDFCYRAREAGWEVWYEPAAEMYHYENTTTAGSPDLNFRYITIRNGLEFKRRWQHRFSAEGGPPDEECRWRDLPTRTVEETGVPPVV